MEWPLPPFRALKSCSYIVQSPLWPFLLPCLHSSTYLFWTLNTFSGLMCEGFFCHFFDVHVYYLTCMSFFPLSHSLLTNDLSRTKIQYEHIIYNMYFSKLLHRSPFLYFICITAEAAQQFILIQFFAFKELKNRTEHVSWKTYKVSN